MKLVLGIHQGVFTYLTPKFYYDLQAKSSSFWGIERKSRQMSTYVTKRTVLFHETRRMTLIASTGAPTQSRFLLGIQLCEMDLLLMKVA